MNPIVENIQIGKLVSRYAGGYRIGPTGKMGDTNAYLTLMLTKKPCWLHRKMTKLLLGWEWSDSK